MSRHLAWCSQCGDEILKGDACRVVVVGPAECHPPEPWIVRPRTTYYTCERCIAGEALTSKLSEVNAMWRECSAGCACLCHSDVEDPGEHIETCAWREP